MTKRLFLHVGLPHCGSASIRRFLATGTEALAAAGVSYRHHPEAEARQAGNGQKLGHAMLDPEAGDWRAVAEYLLGDDSDVLVSAEMMAGFFNVPHMRALAEMAADRGFETQVLVFVCRQDLWAEADFANYLQSARRSADTLPARIAERERQGLMNVATALRRWERLLGPGRVTVEPLQPYAPQGHAVRRLLALLGASGIPDAALVQAAAPDHTVPAGLLEPARLLKARFLSEWQGTGETQRRVAAFLEEAPGLIDVPARRYLQTRAERAALLARFAAPNAEVAGRLGEKALFDDRVEEDPASEAPLAPEAEAVLAAYLSRRPVTDAAARKPPTVQDGDVPAEARLLDPAERAGRVGAGAPCGRRLFLHVGMPKCATTSVQAFLETESAFLASKGVSYRFPPQETTPWMGNAAQLAHVLMYGGKTDWHAMLDAHLDTDGDIVVSSEQLFPLHHAPRMEEVAARIAERGLSTEVIVYLRRQDLWLESDFKQQVKTAQPMCMPLSEWIPRRRAYGVLNYAMTLTYFGKWFGREAIRPVILRPGQSQDFPVAKFLELIGVTGVPQDRIAAARPQNVSPPTGLIEPARLLKERLLAAGESPEAAHVQLSRFFEEAPDLIDVPNRRFLMTHARRTGLVRSFRGENRDLSDRFLTGPAFDEVVSADPASDVPLAEEAAALLAAYLDARPRQPDPRAPRYGTLRRMLAGARNLVRPTD